MPLGVKAGADFLDSGGAIRAPTGAPSAVGDKALIEMMIHPTPSVVSSVKLGICTRQRNH